MGKSFVRMTDAPVLGVQGHCIVTVADGRTLAEGVPPVQEGDPVATATLVSSSDSEYHALCSGEHAEVYHLVNREGVWRMDHLFTLRRNAYHTTTFIAAFRRAGTEWRLVFGRRHQGLSVYSLPQGLELFRDCKPKFMEFLGRATPIPVAESVADMQGRFWWCWAWMWGAYSTPGVLDMQAVAEGRQSSVKLAVSTEAEGAKLNTQVMFSDDFTCYTGDWIPLKWIRAVEAADAGTTMGVRADLVECPGWDMEGGVFTWVNAQDRPDSDQ